MRNLVSNVVGDIPKDDMKVVYWPPPTCVHMCTGTCAHIIISTCTKADNVHIFRNPHLLFGMYFLLFLSIFQFKKYFILCVWDFCLLMYVPVCLMFEEVRREPRILWNWSYRWLRPTMCVLGIEPKSCGRMVSALTC